MNESENVPTVPGFYWVRQEGRPWTVVKIEESGDEMCFQKGYFMLPCDVMEAEWRGPIQEPEDE